MQETATTTKSAPAINLGHAKHNLRIAPLYEEAIRNGEGKLADSGSLVVSTGQYTGRSPKDKFVVKEPSSEDKIWWGSVNQPLDEDKFNALRDRMFAHMKDKQLYVQDLFVGADPGYRLSVRVITETAWANLFARNLFIRPSDEELREFEPNFTVVDVPSFKADASKDGTRTKTFITLNMGQRLVLVGDTEYAGE